MPNNIKAFLATLTRDPGVYRMLDVQGNVLYVGKATNLKKRVSSYFNKAIISPRTRALVEQIASIEVSVTRSETEALLLESNLIKTLHPKYNVLMRDDKSYPYIHIDRTHPFPRMLLSRRRKKEHAADYFGPYPSVAAAHEAIHTIQKIFKLRNCQNADFSHRTRPCLQYQIHRCTAPCVAYITTEAYREAVNEAVLFLEGKSQEILTRIDKQIKEAVERMAFEEAVLLRDQGKRLRLIQQQQGIVQGAGDADVIVLHVTSEFACVQWAAVREGHVVGSQAFFPKVPDMLWEEETHEEAERVVLEAFIGFYYLDMPQKIPSCLILEKNFPQLPTIAAMLKEVHGKPCEIKIHPRGIKARWLDFALNNLRLSIEKYQTSDARMRSRMTALCALLAAQQPFKYMACFDISHTQGEATVASCVVFNEQGPLLEKYRRFNITGIQPGDDYAAMEQALTRFLTREKTQATLPDLLLIDGGKGQIRAALRVLKALEVESIRLIGIAKGVTRKAGWERILLEREKKEITLATDSPALHLLQHLRDEAHRFAITSHRKKRKSIRLESSLETLEGIGAVRRRALIRWFGGIQALALAPLEEIEKVPGIGRDTAVRIFQHFHSD